MEHVARRCKNYGVGWPEASRFPPVAASGFKVRARIMTLFIAMTGTA
ncbi:hypothetical protein CES85_5335 [Ochrobactrum quorumnocens]|uniref:Uncharacterized protein n=1 Tax=Ochrobactrum quorumnocens TaxID=271865 RepID=A0A248UDC3_9HYPH|nr:hypothetical protein CES85_5335 [[Ochrobactrum] quorumnocens]